MVLVNIEKCVTLRTNLVEEDCLSQILKKPGNVFLVLSAATKALKPRLLGQRLQLPLNSLEVACRESALNVNGGSYRTVSLYPGVSSRPRSLGVS